MSHQAVLWGAVDRLDRAHAGVSAAALAVAGIARARDAAAFAGVAARLHDLAIALTRAQYDAVALARRPQPAPALGLDEVEQLQPPQRGGGRGEEGWVMVRKNADERAGAAPGAAAGGEAVVPPVGSDAEGSALPPELAAAPADVVPGPDDVAEQALIGSLFLRHRPPSTGVQAEVPASLWHAALNAAAGAGWTPAGVRAVAVPDAVTPAVAGDRLAPGTATRTFREDARGWAIPEARGPRLLGLAAYCRAGRLIERDDARRLGAALRGVTPYLHPALAVAVGVLLAASEDGVMLGDMAVVSGMPAYAYGG